MRKQIISAILSATLLIMPCVCSVSAKEAEHPDVIWGDINFDSIVSISDATAVQRILAEINSYNVLDIINDETLLDINKDGSVSISDATELQKYLAEFDGTNPKTNTVAFKWRDAEYEDVYPTKTITIIDKEAYDETVEAPVHQTGVETRCIYKATGATVICNDCDMPLIHDDGTTFSSAEIGNHISAHKFGLIPCTTHKDRLVWIDPNWYHWDICEYNTAEKPVAISYTEPRTGEKVSFTLSYDEAVKRLGDKPAHTWVTDEDYMEWGRQLDYYRMGWTDTYPEKDRCFILNGGNYGSWRNNYPSKIRPSGQMETIPINDYVPEYRSGYAWVCRRCGKVAYFEDGKEYDQRDRERHTVGNVNRIREEYAKLANEIAGPLQDERDEAWNKMFEDIPDEEKAKYKARYFELDTIIIPEKYKELGLVFMPRIRESDNKDTCPELLENGRYPVPNWYPETLGGFDWVWTDKIPTGRFTDVPKATTTVTVHHDAVTHTEEVTNYDAEPIDKKLIKPEGYYAVQ